MFQQNSSDSLMLWGQPSDTGSLQDDCWNTEVEEKKVEERKGSQNSECLDSEVLSKKWGHVHEESTNVVMKEPAFEGGHSIVKWKLQIASVRQI